MRTRRSPPGCRCRRSTQGQQILDAETKLIHHAIRIAAYNTAQCLARAIISATGYTRAWRKRSPWGVPGRLSTNAVAEAFNSTLEWELLRNNHFQTREQARHNVAAWD